uniref:LRAT domain-containing protein n=1 Tax=Tetraselmis chuii TaxID=63592 RepID=A0A7S1SSF9_9CHLO|mmetsp:Transcript_27260/g.48564  ORF Transcript_27260/g.48564 Transcript_27260/m.48564 type:complete len:394 (+) Transcript_27260:91-1272(+)
MGAGVSTALPPPVAPCNVRCPLAEGCAATPAGSAAGAADSCPRARHVRVQRHFLGFEPFYHHGVDLGDGRVAHYCKDPGEESDIEKQGGSYGRARVRITSMERFRLFSDGEVDEVLHVDAADAVQVRERVMSLLGRQGYNVVFSNCEHFATYCFSGDFRSSQVEEVFAGLAALQHRTASAATEKLLSRPRDADGAPFLHSRPHWTEMVVVSALDAASAGLKFVLDSAQHYSEQESARVAAEGRLGGEHLSAASASGADTGDGASGRGAGQEGSDSTCPDWRSSDSDCLRASQSGCACCGDAFVSGGAGCSGSRSEAGGASPMTLHMRRWPQPDLAVLRDAGMGLCKAVCASALSVAAMAIGDNPAPSRSQRYAVAEAANDYDGSGNDAAAPSQ